MTIALGAVVLVSLAFSYQLNLWNRHFFDALQTRDAAVVWHQALLFPLLIAGYLGMCVFAMWARMTMQRTWRAALNGEVLDQWLSGSRFYQIEMLDGDHKNPEHRINDDVRVATEMPVDLVTGFLTSILSACTFFAVLWSVGGSISVSTIGVTIPGYMLFAAVIYAFVFNGAMLIVGRPFIRNTRAKNQAEAEYRFALATIRENAECIALLRGAPAERNRVDRSFAELLARWTALVGQNMRAVIVSQGHSQMCGIVPLLLCAPRFLDGTMTLGAMMQLASAFAIVQGAMSWFVDNFSRIADWTASAQRIGALLSALDELRANESIHEKFRANTQAAVRGLRIRDLTVSLPAGVAAVQSVSASFAAGEKVLLTGDSGAGKTLIVRALAGVWTWARGEIVSAAPIYVVPQRPYVPDGSLRSAVTYPLPPTARPTEEIVEALVACGLGGFAPFLDEERSWRACLSEGEKQRLAFARLLMHRPEVVVLDEATSALHVRAQADMMRLVLSRLSTATVISVAHRPELAAFHQRKLTIGTRPGGARVIGDEAIPVRGRPAYRTANSRTAEMSGNSPVIARS